MSKKHTNRNSINTGPVAGRFWNISHTGNEAADITIYGDVVADEPIDWWTMEALPGDFVTPRGFRESLAAVSTAQHLTIRINSVGGCVLTGLAIYNALKAHPARKTVVVEGSAMSIASVIMCVGDEIRMRPGSIVMIHGVSSFLCDYVNLQDVQKYVRTMECMESVIAGIYSGHTGRSAEELRSMMRDETWFTPQEAIDAGFAHQVVTGGFSARLSLVASGNVTRFMCGNRLISANLSNSLKAKIPGHFGITCIEDNPARPTPSATQANNMANQTKLKNIKSKLAALAAKAANVKASLDEETQDDLEQQIEEINEEIETLETELEQAIEEENPDNSGSDDDEESENSGDDDDMEVVDEEEDDEINNLRNAVKTAKGTTAKALAKERLRCAMIDKLAGKVPGSMIQEAKYGSSKMTAQQLAYKAMQLGKNTGASFMKNRVSETNKAKGIKANPQGGTQDQKGKPETITEAQGVVKAIKAKYSPAS